MNTTPDIIKDFSRLQCEVNALSVSNLALAQRIMRMREALRKANNMLAGFGLGDKSPLRLEIADILSNNDLPRKAGGRGAGISSMIAIVNTGPHDDPNPLGERTYEVRINSKVITTFRHRRGDGLGQCLLAASKAVEKQKWTDIEHFISANVPDDLPPLAFGAEGA